LLIPWLSNQKESASRRIVKKQKGDGMNLLDIKGSYDLIAGLGSWCGPALHLNRYNFRKSSFPLDWVQSPFLSDVNRLLKNRFAGYMELENMTEKDILAHFVDNGNVIYQPGGTEPARAHYVHDSYYKIDSVHDFPMIPYQDWKVQYPAFKEKLNRRIQRFLTKIAQSQSTLFIRYEWLTASYKDIIELHSVLSELTNGKFNLLIMQPVGGVQGVIDMNWPIDGICFVTIPRDEDPNNHAIWDQVLQGITLTN
jgi:hypothetical protein